MPVIEVQRLRKRYRGGVVALESVDLRVEEGEVFGLLGRNGAGKTTLVKILLGLVHASAGTARIRGIDCGRASARVPVGFLPEDHRFPEHLTATQTLHFFGTLSGLDPSTLRRRAPDLLEQMSLTEAAHRKVRTFSKGMKQRLGLAQAMIHEPSVLLLDEPTDGVDPVGRAEIRGVIERIREQGTTILLNSHLLSEVERICDRIAILDRGRLLREGSLGELTGGDPRYEMVTEPALERSELDERSPVSGVQSANEGARPDRPTSGELYRELAAGGVSIREVPREAAASASSEVDRSHGRYHVSVPDETGLDAVVDALRRRGIGLRLLRPLRSDLEQVFLQTLGAESVVDEGGQTTPATAATAGSSGASPS